MALVGGICRSAPDTRDKYCRLVYQEFHLLYYKDLPAAGRFFNPINTKFSFKNALQTLRIQKLGLKRKSQQQRPAFEHLRSYITGWTGSKTTF